MWGNLHVSPSPIQIPFRRTRFPPSVQFAVTHHINDHSSSPLHLSLSFLSSCRTPSLCSQLQTKLHFPSQHFNISIYATSHAYHTYRLTNGRQVEQVEFYMYDHASRLRFITSASTSRENATTRILQERLQHQDSVINVRLPGHDDSWPGTPPLIRGIQ